MLSSNGERNRGRVPYVSGKKTPWQPGDQEQGCWSYDRLIAMDRRFCERVERAFENGSEHRQSAVTNGANASCPR
jgi:hypothetical protein